MAPETDTLEPGPLVRDAKGDVSPAFLAVVERAVATDDAGEAKRLAGALHEADVGDVIAALEPNERTAFIRLLGRDFDFAVLTELDDRVRAQILDQMPAAEVAEGMRELESDDAISILEDLEPDEQAEILERLPAEERIALTRVLDYPAESAGRLMQTDFIAVPPFWTVGQAIDYLRQSVDLPDQFYQLLVVDTAYHLTGTVSLDRLLRSGRPTSISGITDPARHLVKATDDQEDVARLFERYNLVSAAVVDNSGRLVGVVTIDDVVDVIEEEADEDLKALGGVAAGEELSDSVWTIARSRFSWLIVNLVTAVLASFVIGIFESELQRMVALAVLMPIVASQGGNAGTQTMTVAVRALATRELGSKNALRVIGREAMVGLFNGLAFAVIIGVIATAWYQVPGLGIVIGLAMLINMVAAALGGILIPLGLRWLRADPAVASGAFVTTVTDVTGFFAFLGLATWWFALS